MDKDIGSFQKIEAEYQELNNELVVPAYRKFCAEINLPFHFRDELPAESFNSKISLDEFHLHNEAMDLFNRLKPEIVFFKDSIVRFQFISWDGGFEYTKIPIHNFLEEISDDLFYLKNLERRFDTIALIVAGLSAVIVFCLIVFLVYKFAPLEILKQSSLWIGLILAGPIAYWLFKSIKRMPRKILDDGRLSGISERTKNLQEKLTQVRGMGEDPYKQKRTENLPQKLQESMASSYIEKFVEQLKKRLAYAFNGQDPT